MLHLEAVEPDTLELLRHLQEDPCFGGLRLVGGTALALQLGHRRSVDLDFFGPASVAGDELEAALRAHGRVTPTRIGRHVSAFVVQGVRVDFVEYAYPWLEPPVVEGSLRLASMQDIAAMKLAAVTNRGTRKDFVDVAFLLDLFSLDQMLGFYRRKYTDGSLFLVMKSLAFFDDAEEDPMPRMLVPFDWGAARTRIVRAVADTAFRPDLA
jgi:predicted nucleotidyltransferase component of viral defense system